MRIVLVGICGSGKSTLARALRQLGYEVRECVQEHSDVPYMWQVISRPDVLIYLDASEETVLRRGEHHYIRGFVEVERRRLAHARAHCDLCILTDELTEAEVLQQATDFLAGLAPSQAPDLTGH
jgi:broad-specificity NMP kinase